MQLEYRRYARRAVAGLLGEGTRLEGLQTFYNHSQGTIQTATLDLTAVSIVEGDPLELIIKSSLHDSHVWSWCVPEDGLTDIQVQTLIYNALKFDPILAAIARVQMDSTTLPVINLTGVTPGVEFEICVGVGTSGFAPVFTVTQPSDRNTTCIPFGHVVTQLATTPDECSYAHLPLGGEHPEELFLGIAAFCQHNTLDDLRLKAEFPPKPICDNECCGYGPNEPVKVLEEGAIWVKIEELSPFLSECTTAVPMYRAVIDPALPYTLGSVSAVSPADVGSVVNRLEFPVDARFIEFFRDEKEGLYGLLHIDDADVTSP
jgi:hypothetical protein